MRYFALHFPINPASVALAACTTTVIVYAIITAWWIASGNGEPGVGWSQHVVSAILQMAGWSFLSFVVAQLVAGIHRRLGTALDRRKRA